MRCRWVLVATVCACAEWGCREGSGSGTAPGVQTSGGVVAAVSGTGATAGPIPGVGLDLSDVDDQGLHGPPDGKRALGYEFCIPQGAAYADAVRALDPTVQFMPGSRGRIRCEPGSVLCVGSTHQPGWRSVLERLAALAYIDTIGPYDAE